MIKNIVKIFKHIFIPHEHNDFKPHFFRELSITISIIVAIVLFSFSASTKLYIDKTDMTAAVLPAVLVDLTNNVRESSGVVTLARNSILDQAAQLKANDMAEYSYFAHTSPQGVTPWAWFSKVNYTFVYAGENLAVDFSESEDVENAWLNSPTHKANILNSKFTEIGIATSEGYYKGHPTIFVVQMFGKPAFASVPSPVTDVKKTTSVPKVSKTVVAEEPVKKVAVSTVTETTNVMGETAVLGEDLETITETDEFVSVKNTAVTEEVAPVESSETKNEVKKYSTFGERLLFLAPLYANSIYRIFIYIVIISLLLMIFIEIKTQHRKNIIYGVLLTVILLCLVYINKTIFVIDFL